MSVQHLTLPFRFLDCLQFQEPCERIFDLFVTKSSLDLAEFLQKRLTYSARSHIPPPSLFKSVRGVRASHIDQGRHSRFPARVLVTV